VGETIGEADGVVVVAGAVRSKAVAAPVPSGAASRSVPSVCGGGSDGPTRVPIRPSERAERNVERMMAATNAPTSTTGARTAVRGKCAHGESPAWVRPRRR